MKKIELYQQIGSKHKLPTHKIKNSIFAFISGGTIGLLSQFVYFYLMEVLHFNDLEASNCIVIGVVGITAFTTGIGIYDKLAQICGAGLFIPISGFANALTSCAIEFRSEGLIYGIGSNMFKLAGSVITYGIVSVYLFGLIRFLLNL